jgi:hypothetical protein
MFEHNMGIGLLDHLALQYLVGDQCKLVRTGNGHREEYGRDRREPYAEGSATK